MSKFNYYLEKAREQNNVGREILEEEKIEIADSFLEEEEETCCKDKSCDGIKCKEKDINESISIKTKVKLVLNEEVPVIDKAKKIKKLFLETGIEQKQVIEKLSESFGVDSETKEALLKFY